MSSSPQTQYSISHALLGLGDDQLRAKGEQRGSVRMRGGSWHITFSQWVADEAGGLKYQAVSRKVGPARGPDRLTKRDAEKVGYEKFVMPANGPSHCPQGQATVQQFVDSRFRPDHINGTLKKTGKQFYESILRCHVLPSLGSIKMADVKPHVVQALISAKRDAGLSGATVRHIRNVISAIFGHAEALGFHEGRRPTNGMKMPPVEEKKRIPVSAAQADSIMCEISPKYQGLVVVMAKLGLRIGEATGLRWKNVNLEDTWKVGGPEPIAPYSVLICENWVRGQRTTLKTRSSWRKLPLTASAWVALMLHHETTQWIDEEHPVFASRVGTPVDGHNIAERHLKKAGKAVGIPWVHWHAFRHGAASAADPYMTPSQKMEMLGHAAIQQSNKYTHVALMQLRAAMEKIESNRPN